jgi:hypothetical protein
MSLAACIPLHLGLVPSRGYPADLRVRVGQLSGYVAPDKFLRVFSARAGIYSGIISAHRADLRQRYGTNVTGEPSLLLMNTNAETRKSTLTCGFVWVAGVGFEPT